jgi:hypothetical protein
MVVMEVMRVVEHGDHELQSVLQKRQMLNGHRSMPNAQCGMPKIARLRWPLGVGHWALIV